MPNKLSLCALCSKEIKTKKDKTRDDAIPSTLWPKGTKPSIFVRVDTHSKCNEKYQHDETYFRDVIALAAIGQYGYLPISPPPLLNQLYNNEISRSVKKRHSNPWKWFRERGNVNVYSASGLYLGFGVEVEPMDKQCIDRVLFKIVKDLYWHRNNGKPLPNNRKIKTVLNQQFFSELNYYSIDKILQTERWCSSGDGVVSYRCIHTNDVDGAAIWEFLFYGIMRFMVFTM